MVWVWVCEGVDDVELQSFACCIADLAENALCFTTAKQLFLSASPSPLLQPFTHHLSIPFLGQARPSSFHHPLPRLPYYSSAPSIPVPKNQLPCTVPSYDPAHDFPRWYHALKSATASHTSPFPPSTPTRTRSLSPSAPMAVGSMNNKRAPSLCQVWFCSCPSLPPFFLSSPNVLLSI